MSHTIASSVTPEVRLAPAPGVQVREVDGELVVLDIDQNRFSGLDRVGTRIWQRLAAGRSPEEVASELAARYPNVPQETLAGDVLRLTGEFIERGWMISAEATPR